MIKLCDKSIIPAISLIYQNCINSEIFSNIWKKSNIVPIHKMGDKQVVDNITDQFHFYQFLVKFLKGLFLIHYLNLFMKIICLMRVNQDSDHLIHVDISSYQLYIIYMHPLTVTHLYF